MNNQIFPKKNPRYAREFPDPYLGHGIGPVPGYGVSNTPSYHELDEFTQISHSALTKPHKIVTIPLQTAMYRGGYNRFAPY